MSSMTIKDEVADMQLDLDKELRAAQISHDLTMAYITVTDVLIRNNKLPYELYHELKEQVRIELNRLKIHLLKDSA